MVDKGASHLPVGGLVVSRVWETHELAVVVKSEIIGGVWQHIFQGGNSDEFCV